MSLPLPPGGHGHGFTLTRRRAGAALVIVLAFVVLLTGLIVAYFARSMTSRQLSNSSAGQTKAGLLAQSASDIVIAGLKKEIVGGSTMTVVGPSGNQSSIYVPLAPANAVPVRFATPSPSPAELIPNLVRRSVAGDAGATSPIPSPAVPSLASAVNSATDPAVGGRKITPARWNSHYLIPRAATAADTDSAPDPNVHFVAPDWVLMTRHGPFVKTATDLSTINNAQATNQEYVTGRYAYAIYDEGGLLDMNVAGHPTPAATPASTGFTSAQLSRKGSLALADLTNLPIVKAPTSPDPVADPGEYLTQTVVDSIVGWRNFASGAPSGTFPGFTFSTGNAASWYANFASNNTTGFLKVYGGAANSTGPTDQGLLSRQQLLRLRGSIGFNANVLQYMGTFSRSLEQPSYVPDPQRPKIVTKSLDTAPLPPSSPSTTPPSSPGADNYIGNNDAVGADDIINPSFLSVRVTNGFLRVNGTTALAGEPLVKTKFALSRLALVTFSSTAPQTTGGNHIYDYFGLSRTVASQPWVYNHGSTHIMTLSEVATAGREPDFAELLKAAINVGSLGKGGPQLNTPGQSNYQYVVDISVDLQVLQIMANLIDQYDTDSYPTIIQVSFPSPAGTVTRTVRGVEDLPYFYRYHGMSVVTKVPSPANLQSDAVTFFDYNPGVPSQRGSQLGTVAFCKPNVSLSSPGEGVMLFVPEVWNPHDATPTYAGTPPGARPGSFRITASTDDPAGQAPWLTYAQDTVETAYTGKTPNIPDPSIYPTATHAAMTEASTGLVFSDNGGKLFREPTLLWQLGVPTGANIGADAGSSAGPYVDANTGISYFGMFVGKTPLNFSGKVSKQYIAADPTNPNSNLSQDSTYVFQPSATWYGTDFGASGTGFDQITFRVEYQDPNDGHWVAYDEQYPDFHQMGNSKWVINKNDAAYWPNSRWANPERATQFGNHNATLYDPRTARFGMGTSSSLNNYASNGNSYLCEAGPAQMYFNDDSDTGNKAFGMSKHTVIETQRPGSDTGNGVNYSNPCMTSNPGRNVQMRWFSGLGYSANNGGNSPHQFDGLLFGQNNPAVTLPTGDGSKGGQHLYYEDPDGIARRAMGAYVDTLQFNAQGVQASGLPFGQPLLQCNNYPAGSGGVGTPNTFNINRPLILNRPFQSVAEMSYAFRGEPWKQLDLFTPESGDTTLLDVFCVNEPPADGLVAGKVNLNTHQVPVLKAMVAGAYRDELKNLALSPAPSYATAPLDGTEAFNIASKLVGITTDFTDAWRGPLVHVGNLVGHYVATPGATGTATDVYNFTETASGTQYTYAGLSAALDQTVFSTSTPNKQYTPKIQRLRESAVRALADGGQTRVWNLLIDVVAQTGRYSPNATRLADFVVDGEQRCWVHVAIDRFTGEVLDKQVEVVTE